MSHQHNNGSTTLPRGFRFHHEEERPRTPESMEADEPQQPSPPRPAPRLKIRRRNLASFQTPTEHFLASVAAADVPIPTIEEPQVGEDYEMMDSGPFIQTSGFLAPSDSFRDGFPPKTPMPMLSMEESSRRPDWSASTSSPDYFQRPMSALSNSSSFSDDSLYSGSRVSHRSEDGSCTSPESDDLDPFQFPHSISKGKSKGRALYPDQLVPVSHLNAQLRSKTRKDAHWTKAQSAHLWSTYLLYLQDPTVTPFRIGASAVPPQGIIIRVAREAKRSWKGPKLPAPTVRRSARLGSIARDSKSGSITPTAETPKIYAQWPHSSSATRLHLRELCKSKSKNSNPVQLHHHLQSRSPTPFSKPYRSVLDTSDPPRLTAFNTNDIALSLATSTAESMQPDGPLAKLNAGDLDETRTTIFTLPEGLSLAGSQRLALDEVRGRRLGSPFARTYGPSSSEKLLNPYRPSPPRPQFDSTVIGTEPSLGSPVRFEEPRSLNGTMKRRAQHSLEEELSPNGAVLRPSILNEQLFGIRTPLLNSQRRVRSRGFSLGDAALRHRIPGIFQPSPIVGVPEGAPTAPESAASIQPTTIPKLLPALEFDPPRLGSPFSESGPSKTFPRRLFQDGGATIRRGAFATMHQTRRSIESFDFGEGPSLQSRLSHLDEKLKEIRDREAAAAAKKTEHPFH